MKHDDHITSMNKDLKWFLFPQLCNLKNVSIWYTGTPFIRGSLQDSESLNFYPSPTLWFNIPRRQPLQEVKCEALYPASGTNNPHTAESCDIRPHLCAYVVLILSRKHAVSGNTPVVSQRLFGLLRLFGLSGPMCFVSPSSPCYY